MSKSDKTQQNNDKEKELYRISPVVSEELYNQICYWAGKRNMSKTEFVKNSVQLAIDIQNDNFTDPTFTLNRISELTEHISVMEDKLDILATTITKGFDALLRVTRGENYLDKDEDNYDPFG